MVSVGFPHPPSHKFGIADILKGVHFHPRQRIRHQLGQGITAVLRLLPGGTGVQKHGGTGFTYRGTEAPKWWENARSGEKSDQHLKL